MASTDKFITESQLKEILSEFILAVNIDEDNKISKDKMLHQIEIMNGIVNKLNISLRKVHEFSSYKRKVYIPVSAQSENDSPFDLGITIVNSAKSAMLGLYIPPKYSMFMSATPVVTFMNVGSRDILTSVSVKFIEVSRASQLGVKEYYYEIDMCLDSMPNFVNQIIDIQNHKGIVEITDDIYKTDSVADTTINIIKEITVDAEIKSGFDDIPNRDKLVRSDTIRQYEVVSQEQYQDMELNGNIDSNTVYSIPERLQINE